MEVFLYPNTLKDQHLLVTRRAAKILRKAGVGLLAPLGCEEALSQTETRFLPGAQAFSEADAVLTVGGDGTLLRAAACCVAAGKPVLGVNLGRTGGGNAGKACPPGGRRFPLHRPRTAVCPGA